MTTVNDISARALRRLGVLAVEQVPNTSQSTTALETLNEFVDKLKSENLAISTITRTTSALTASQPSFTVGTGGNINILRPNLQQVERVGYVDNSVSPAIEYSMGNLMTEAEYEAIPLKSMTSALPWKAYYNPTYPLGTLIPWPISTGANLLWVIYHHTPVDEFAAVTDTVALPPGYRLMLITNLALGLAPQYNRDPSPLLVKQASDSLAAVKRSNTRLVDMAFPADTLTSEGRAMWIRSGGPV